MVVAMRDNIDLFNPTKYTNQPLPTAFSFSNFSIEKSYLNSMTTEKHYYISFNLELTLSTRVNFEKGENVSYKFINTEHNFPTNCLTTVTNPVIAPYAVVSAPWWNI